MARALLHCQETLLETSYKLKHKASGHQHMKTNDSVSISIQLKLSLTAKSTLKEVDLIWGHVSPFNLGFEGAADGLQWVMVMDLGLRHAFNCSTQKGDYCTIKPDVCVTFHGPTSVVLLPRVKEPKACLSRRMPQKHDKVFTLLPASSESAEEARATRCLEGTRIHQKYVPDPSLDETLSYNEQTLMNMHLMYTSYFLFVTVMTVVCYALVRGHAKQTTKSILLIEKAASV